jgi:hypothetical protein
MSPLEDRAVVSSGRIFAYSQNAIGARFSDIHERIRQRALALPEDQLLATDPAKWAREISSELTVATPNVDTDAHEFAALERIDVNVTGWPGISFTLAEWGGAVRPGHRFRVMVSGKELRLLQSRLNRGGMGWAVDIENGKLARVYQWPEVLPAAELQADVDRFLTDLQSGAHELAEEVARRNRELPSLAEGVLIQRQEEIRRSRAYLGDLRLTVTRDPAADTTIPALPPRRPRPVPSASRDAHDEQSPSPALRGPTLDAFYDHVVTVLAAVALGFERSARRFAGSEEEALRDFILVTLNSHYEGAATGETFNGSGKTDILVRHGLDNAFIGECKFWGGKVKFAETFEQLLGYTTWQDNRLAIILFVRNKTLQPIIDAARDFLGGRPEFASWRNDSPSGQLRCRLRWEDTARKEGRLTVFLVHLSPQS